MDGGEIVRRRTIIVQTTPRQRAIYQRGLAFSNCDRLPTERIFAIRHSRAHNGIGNQDRSFNAFGANPHLEHSRVDMEVIRDKFAANLIKRECRADGAGLPVMKADHGIEGMRRLPCPKRDGVFKILVSGLRVPNRNVYTTSHAIPDKLLIFGKLRRNRDLLDHTKIKPAIIFGGAGPPDIRTVLRALHRQIEVWSLKMDAKQRRSVRNGTGASGSILQ